MSIEDQKPINETMQVVIMGASIAGKEAVSMSIRVSGEFDRPGNHVEIEPIVIVATIPAKVFPR